MFAGERRGGGFLNGEERPILRTELRKLMRIERIDRPDALYDASVAARAFEDVNAIGADKIGFGENVSAMVSDSIGDSRSMRIGRIIHICGVLWIL